VEELDWEDVVRQCAGFDQVLVTGPQRSGTTIGAKVLARELELLYIDEQEIPTVREFFGRIVGGDRFVAQAPRFCAYLHLFGIPVVVMRRPLEEIVRSQQRIGWQYEAALPAAGQGIAVLLLYVLCVSAHASILGREPSRLRPQADRVRCAGS